MNDQIAQAVAARMAETGMSRAELVRASGASWNTIRGVLSGAGVTRDDKRRDIANALGWTLDSFAKIEAGGSPELVEQPQIPADALEAQSEWIARQIREALAPIITELSLLQRAVTMTHQAIVQEVGIVRTHSQTMLEINEMVQGNRDRSMRIEGLVIDLIAELRAPQEPQRQPRPAPGRAGAAGAERRPAAPSSR